MEPRPRTPIDVAAIRAEFPALHDWTYLNTATYGLMPARAVAADAAHWAARGPLACATFLTWYDEADRIRGRLAALIHASPEDIAFVPNAASALATLVAGIDWRSGDEVVTLTDEFPDCLYLPALLDRRGVTVREVPRESLVDVERVAGPRTRLVALSQVNYASGFRPALDPLTRHLRERGILFYVDGTQCVGGLQVDVRDGPDVLAVHGYKWLLSPTGAGFMYVAPSVRSRLPPNVIGWRSNQGWRDVDDLSHGRPSLPEGASRYEGGGLPFGLLHAMGASVDWLLELGPAAIEAHVLALATALRGRLVALGAEAAPTPLPSPIVAVRFPGRESSALGAGLRAARVLVAARHGWLRVSPHLYNDADDLDRLETALAPLVDAR